MRAPPTPTIVWRSPAAAAAILARRVPTTLIPYEVAREVGLGGADLDRMAAAGGANAWVAGRAREWLEFWRTDVGLAGFYPFDAVAAMYLTTPQLFSCAHVSASVGEDEALGLIGRLIGQSTGLLVRAGDSGSAVLYCPAVESSALHRLMTQRLSARPGQLGPPEPVRPPDRQRSPAGRPAPLPGM